MNYATFFTQATGHPPYGWQGRLACGEGYQAGSSETPHTGTACTSRLIDIPTGLGATTKELPASKSRPLGAVSRISLVSSVSLKHLPFRS